MNSMPSPLLYASLLSATQLCALPMTLDVLHVLLLWLRVLRSGCGTAKSMNTIRTLSVALLALQGSAKSSCSAASSQPSHAKCRMCLQTAQRRAAANTKQSVQHNMTSPLVFKTEGPPADDC
jgi:hypothetical protein